MSIKQLRSEDGKLPTFAWPGGYPLYYMTADGGCICPGCANGENGSDAHEDSDDPQWQLVGQGVHYEGPPLTCDHCNAEIESAYGDPDIEESGPAEDDYTTADHIRWYQHGKLVLTTADPNDPSSSADDCLAQVKAHMEQEKFFPNAWFISDHGNAHLLNLD